MTFNVLTIFPGMFQGFLGETMMKRAIEAGVVGVNLVDIRDFATDKHRTTDDTPYGGGPGMVMRVEPIFNALQALKESGISKLESGKRRPNSKFPVKARGPRGFSGQIPNSRIVLLSPRGRPFDQRAAEEYAKLEILTLICGRYEGVDQRVADHLADEELSIGPYVLSGGEVAAMVVMEAVARLVPGFLGNPESLKEESFGLPATSYQLQVVEYPQYTKPEDFLGWKVPEVLLSGDHKKIADWRKKHAKHQ